MKIAYLVDKKETYKNLQNEVKTCQISNKANKRYEDEVKLKPEIFVCRIYMFLFQV